MLPTGLRALIHHHKKKPKKNTEEARDGGWAW